MSTVHQKYAHYIDRSNTAFGNRLDYKHYQAEGISWCLQQENANINGAFIADEMGLGKTIIMIMNCLISYKNSTLIVVPSSLLQQWRDQIKNITGHDALIYHGYSKKNINFKQITSNPIVLTTYHSFAILKKNLDKPSNNILHSINWDRVVYDEAHYLRNRNSLWYGASELKAKFSWFISGTPIQNKTTDFRNLCRLINITPSQAKIMRRTKQQVGIDLSPPIMHNISVSYQNKQEFDLSRQVHYQLQLAHDMTSFIVGIQLCKQACIHPQLLLKNERHIGNHLIEAPHLDNKFIAFQQNSKLSSVANKLYERKDNGMGKIVFCQYKNEMTHLKTILQSSGMSVNLIDSTHTSKHKHVLLKGGSIPENHSIKELPIDISRYINSFLVTDVTILQIQSSCEGLNLQDTFSEVYFVAPSWNPSIEAQAIARCHRIGQKNQVHVFRFYMESFKQTDFPAFDDNIDTNIDNMDQYILQKQKFKNKLANNFYGAI